jgi:hypothetical protein
MSLDTSFSNYGPFEKRSTSWFLWGHLENIAYAMAVNDGSGATTKYVQQSLMRYAVHCVETQGQTTL